MKLRAIVTEGKEFREYWGTDGKRHISQDITKRYTAFCNILGKYKNFLKFRKISYSIYYYEK